MSQPSPRDRFLALLGSAVANATVTKLTLGKPAATAIDPTLRNVFIRPVTLKSGPHFTFVYRHATRDVTKNFPAPEVVAVIAAMLGRDFLDAHLFTPQQTAQLEQRSDGPARLRLIARSGDTPPPAPAEHNQPKHYLVPATAAWLESLGILNARGQPREGMADKFRQIQKFAELLQHLIAEAFPDATLPAGPLRVIDAGSGKGYLTFALATLLGTRAQVTGLEVREELVALCNRIAGQHGLAPGLQFVSGTIAAAPTGPIDLLIALHACDTATDDALAHGHAAGARLLVVSPCCQKEIRPQLTAAPVLADALRHGIFQERQAEFVTDALRAQLLEWAGYQTKVFEFISTEHTAKNLMISALRVRPTGAPDDERARRIREFAAFYGVRRHALARHLDFSLT